MGEFTVGFLLGILAGLALGYGFFKRKQPETPGPETAVSQSAPEPGPRVTLDDLLGGDSGDKAGQLRQNLRLKFMYDEAKVDNAIEFERQRRPGARVEELMEAAIERWERDNR